MNTTAEVSRQQQPKLGKGVTPAKALGSSPPSA